MVGTADRTRPPRGRAPEPQPAPASPRVTPPRGRAPELQPDPASSREAPPRGRAPEPQTDPASSREALPARQRALAPWAHPFRADGWTPEAAAQRAEARSRPELAAQLTPAERARYGLALADHDRQELAELARTGAYMLPARLTLDAQARAAHRARLELPGLPAPLNPDAELGYSDRPEVEELRARAVPSSLDTGASSRERTRTRGPAPVSDRAEKLSRRYRETFERELERESVWRPADEAEREITRGELYRASRRWNDTVARTRAKLAEELGDAHPERDRIHRSSERLRECGYDVRTWRCTQGGDRIAEAVPRGRCGLRSCRYCARRSAASLAASLADRLELAAPGLDRVRMLTLTHSRGVPVQGPDGNAGELADAMRELVADFQRMRDRKMLRHWHGPHLFGDPRQGRAPADLAGLPFCPSCRGLVVDEHGAPAIRARKCPHAHCREPLPRVRVAELVTGGSYAREVTYRPATDDAPVRWHPHLHAVLVGRFVPWGMIREAWRDVTHGRATVVDVRQIRARGGRSAAVSAAKEVAKYLASGFAPKKLGDDRQELAADDGSDELGELGEPEEVAAAWQMARSTAAQYDLATELRGTRSLQSWGSLLGLGEQAAELADAEAAAAQDATPDRLPPCRCCGTAEHWLCEGITDARDLARPDRDRRPKDRPPPWAARVRAQHPHPIDYRGAPAP